MAQINLYRHHYVDENGLAVPVVKAIVVGGHGDDVDGEFAGALKRLIESDELSVLVVEGDHEVRWLA